MAWHQTECDTNWNTVDHRNNSDLNWQLLCGYFHFSLGVGEVDTQGKVRVSDCDLSVRLTDSNVTVINTALMHSPHALSFQWTPRVPVSARSAKSLWFFSRLRHESLNSRSLICCCIPNMLGGFPDISNRSDRVSLKLIMCCLRSVLHGNFITLGINRHIKEK